jgi:hypothetical protein
MRVEKRGYINRGNQNSDYRRKFAQDTKHERFRMIVSRKCAYIYLGEFFVSGWICLLSWLKNILGGRNGFPDGNGSELTYRISRPEPILNRSGDSFRRSASLSE